jgi:hypothetical protein
LATIRRVPAESSTRAVAYLVVSFREERSTLPAGQNDASVGGRSDVSASGWKLSFELREIAERRADERGCRVARLVHDVDAQRPQPDALSRVLGCEIHRNDEWRRAMNRQSSSCHAGGPATIGMSVGMPLTLGGKAAVGLQNP